MIGIPTRDNSGDSLLTSTRCRLSMSPPSPFRRPPPIGQFWRTPSKDQPLAEVPPFRLMRSFQRFFIWLHNTPKPARFRSWRSNLFGMHFEMPKGVIAPDSKATKSRHGVTSDERWCLRSRRQRESDLRRILREKSLSGESKTSAEQNNPSWRWCENTMPPHLNRPHICRPFCRSKLELSWEDLLKKQSLPSKKVSFCGETRHSDFPSNIYTQKMMNLRPCRCSSATFLCVRSPKYILVILYWLYKVEAAQFYDASVDEHEEA